MISTRNGGALESGTLKWTACPRRKKLTSNGGTAMTVAPSASMAAERRGTSASVEWTARSRSRLYSAAPYNTQAWPPINRTGTSNCRIVERTRRIWVGITGASEGMEPRSETDGLRPPLLWRQSHPLRGLLAVQILEGHTIRRRHALSPSRIRARTPPGRRRSWRGCGSPSCRPHARGAPGRPGSSPAPSCPVRSSRRSCRSPRT